ncbi:MAG: prepilin peptidase [Lachnospiraceae bacterium]|nr:prepilin peptidase [Lachnospiraceae bacterium]
MTEWIAVGYALLAMLQDLSGRRISNWFLLAGWLSGGVLALGQSLPGGLLQYLGGALLPLVLLFILFYFRMMGAGDIKLLSVLGGFLGIQASLSLLIGSFLAGAVISVVLLSVTGSWFRRFRFFYRYVCNYRATGLRIPYRPEGGSIAEVHFAVPVFVAVVLLKGGVF